MRQFRPQVTLTFGSEGGVSAHTDHSMAGIFATLAFQWAGRSNRYPDQIREHTSPHRTQKLYYSTTDFRLPGRQPIDRKSTRLNSSHSQISYAVFCLKKKKNYKYTSICIKRSINFLRIKAVERSFLYATINFHGIAFFVTPDRNQCTHIRADSIRHHD